MSEDPFDEKAATWDSDPRHVARAKVVAQVIREQVDLNRSLRTMEYGAGTGLVSEELQGEVGPLTLVDTSAGMREVIAARVAAGRLPAVTIESFDVSGGELPAERYDLIITVLTLHHVPDLAAALRGLHRLLAAQGRLCIVDLNKEDGSFHGEGFAGHHGFDRAELEGALRAAGFAAVRTVDCGQVERDDGKFPMFLALGVAGD